MEFRQVHSPGLTRWMQRPFDYTRDEEDDGPNHAAHIARKEALMKEVSGHEGAFKKGCWAYDKALIAEAKCFTTDAHRNDVVHATADKRVDVWAVHYLESDDRTRLLCFLLIGGSLHMGVLE